jgi:hypothetical protein
MFRDDNDIEDPLVVTPAAPRLLAVAATDQHTALVCAWDGRWEVFVLDPREGLLGRLEVATLGEVEVAVRAFLADRFTRHGSGFSVVILRR